MLLFTGAFATCGPPKRCAEVTPMEDFDVTKNDGVWFAVEKYPVASGLKERCIIQYFEDLNDGSVRLDTHLVDVESGEEIIGDGFAKFYGEKAIFAENYEGVIYHLMKLSVQSSSDRPTIDLNKSPARSPSPPARSRTRSRSPAAPCPQDNASSSGTASSSETPLSVRCISLPLRFRTIYGRACAYEDLPFIRLTSVRNPFRVFNVRRYTFPDNTPMKLAEKNDNWTPMPTQEQIVMATLDGHVFAIIGNREGIAGMYMYSNEYGYYKRSKINIDSGRPAFMTRAEEHDAPVGRHNIFKRNYKLECMHRV